MNIEREETGNLTATLKMKIQPEDYRPGVEKALKEQRKNAVLPGFRPGQVPMTIIKKKVGKAILIGEVERLIDTNLKGYLQQNSLRVLGQPLPKAENVEINNWEEPGEFNFSYELGMAPSFEVNLDKLGVEYTVVDVDDALVTREITDMQRRFGKVEDADVSEDKDMLLGDFIELDPDGSIKPGGILNRATISLEYVTEDATRQLLVGKQKDDEIPVDPHKVSRDPEDMAHMLGLDAEQAQHVGDRFMFRVAEVKRMAPVPIDQTLFDRVYGKDAVSDEAGFRAKVKDGLEQMFRRDSDRLFLRFSMKKIQERTNVELPDRFLKRWIQETSKTPVALEDVEKGYSDYAEGLKRQLVQDRVIETYGLEAKGEEMDAFAKRYVTDQFVQYGMPAPEGEQLQQMAARMLGDQEQINRIRGTIVEQKLMVHFKNLLEPKEKKVSFDEFVTLARTV